MFLGRRSRLVRKADNRTAILSLLSIQCGILNISQLYRPPHPITGIPLLYLILPAALIPGVYSASNRNEYQKQKNNVLGSRMRPARRADNLTAICEPIV
jgi:hypothetical protein